MNFIEYTDRDLMMVDLANRIAGELTQALMTGDRASLAVPGGTTPAPLFDALSGVGLDWSRVDILLTDERWVPEDSPRSNTRLLRERLLVGNCAGARLVPMFLPDMSAEEAMPILGDGVRKVLPLTTVLLGMGTDMHTASIFPGADKLETALSPNAPPLVAMRAPGADEPRITLSAPVLNGAMNKHLLITGTDKRAALTRAEGMDPNTAPIRAVMSELNVHWAI